MEGSKQVLVKVMLFQLREHVHPQDGAMLTFFHEWSSPLLVLSIDVSFVLKFFWKGDKNFKNWTSGPIYMEDPVCVTSPQWHLILKYLWCLYLSIYLDWPSYHIIFFFSHFSSHIQGPPYILDRLFNFQSFYHLSNKNFKKNDTSIEILMKSSLIH